MTIPTNHKTKAIRVKNTWGARCNKLLFFSFLVQRKVRRFQHLNIIIFSNFICIVLISLNEELGSIVINVPEGRKYLWARTKAAFQYDYEHRFDWFADWFYKADADTQATYLYFITLWCRNNKWFNFNFRYALMENMRFMLNPFFKDYPIYFGFKFKH